VRPPPAPFLDRLPPHLRSGLIALEMEDHYVRAHTAGGSALVLLRMRDAVAELAGIEGMQVHRSWWVARSAVREAVASGRNVTLRLERGIEAPVARSSITALREAGWLSANAAL
jgi:DNA-binding LytR/AlgR family response regulator